MKLAIRAVWLVYAVTITTLTHWPQVYIPGQAYRADIFIHIGAFGLWACLFIACGFFGPALSMQNIIRSGVVAAAYALVDELTQAIPGINRVVDPLDLLGNFSGTALATLAAFFLRSRLRQPDRALAP
jgi:hypothetical protein